MINGLSVGNLPVDRFKKWVCSTRYEIHQLRETKWRLVTVYADWHWGYTEMLSQNEDNILARRCVLSGGGFYMGFALTKRHR